MVARKRSVDFGLLTHPPVLKSLPQRSSKPSSTSRAGRSSCELRMQQSLVDVFTRFIIDTNTGRRYFCGKKVYLRITDLVRRQLRVADPDIASIKGTVVRGHLPGRTAVQVSDFCRAADDFEQDREKNHIYFSSGVTLTFRVQNTSCLVFSHTPAVYVTLMG